MPSVIAIAPLLLLALTMLLPVESLADAKAGEQKAQLCLLCHKLSNAIAPLSAIPLLEAQPARYLYLQTKAYKEKQRTDHVMQTNTANLSDRDMRDIADYLSAHKPLRASYQLDPALVAAGKAKTEELKCATCHLPTFHGGGEIPRLAGQTPGYLKAQLEAFAAAKRPHGTGQRSAPAMTLSEHEMDGLAQFFASLE
jgi:cytochrome c553